MNLYTTPQASEVTGIPENTIRSWMRRHAGIFHVGTHIIIEDSGRKLWTDAGIELLRSRTNAPESAPDEDSEISADNFLEQLLEHDSNQLALEYYRQLPSRVIHRIKQMRDNPTPEEKQLITLSFSQAVSAGTHQLLLPTYQPMLLGGGEDETA